MTILEVTYSQFGEVVYKKREQTSHPITQIGVRYWLLKNLIWVLTFPWQGISLNVRKHIDINLLIAGKKGEASNKFLFCRPTTSEVDFHLKMQDGNRYVICNRSYFSTEREFNDEKTFNTIEYHSVPKYSSKGPIRPHPFRN